MAIPTVGLIARKKAIASEDQALRKAGTALQDGKRNDAVAKSRGVVAHQAPDGEDVAGAGLPRGADRREGGAQAVTCRLIMAAPAGRRTEQHHRVPLRAPALLTPQRAHQAERKANSP